MVNKEHILYMKFNTMTTYSVQYPVHPGICGGIMVLTRGKRLHNRIK